jgi:ketosteroid isomerase-like protein
MKSKYLTALAAVLITLTTVFLSSAQNLSTSETEVRKLERAWLDAYEKKDVAAMTAIVADNFTITFSDGSIQTKPQIIESIKRPGGTTSKFMTENVQSRVYGDTVILIGLVISEWKENDKPMTDRSRYTDTYVKRKGKWQVVASHLSTLKR